MEADRGLKDYPPCDDCWKEYKGHKVTHQMGMSFRKGAPFWLALKEHQKENHILLCGGGMPKKKRHAQIGMRKVLPCCHT